jgi:hypothetical protein
LSQYRGFIALFDQQLQLCDGLLQPLCMGALALKDLDLLMVGGQDVLALGNQFFVELLPGAQAGVADLDFFIGDTPGKPDHVSGKINNADWLAHVEHEYL